MTMTELAVVWQFELWPDSNRWEDMEGQLPAALTIAHGSGADVTTYVWPKRDKNGTAIGWITYEVDLKAMTQRNTETDCVRRIRKMYSAQ